MVGNDEGEDEIQEKALAEENVKKWLEGKEIKKVVYVPGKIVNIVL
jgi:leucyl-tRNA synthetase